MKITKTDLIWYLSKLPVSILYCISWTTWTGADIVCDNADTMSVQSLTIQGHDSDNVRIVIDYVDMRIYNFAIKYLLEDAKVCEKLVTLSLSSLFNVSIIISLLTPDLGWPLPPAYQL